MKKTIFAVAVSAALGLGAAQAETVLYGSIRTGVDYTKNHIKYESVRGKGWVAKAKVKNGFNMVDTGSRIGLKGGEDLGNGLQAIFQVEFGYDGVEGDASGTKGFSNRLSYLGLQSEQLGTVVLGRLENPFDKVVVASSIDNMNEVYNFAGKYAAGYLLTGGARTINAAVNPDALPSRVGNAVAYLSPTWSGFSFNVAGVIDGSDSSSPASTFGDNTRGIDMFTVNAKYMHDSGFNAGLGVLSAKRVSNRLGGANGAVDLSSLNTQQNLGKLGASASVDSQMIAGNIGFENDMFKVGLSAITGKSRTENLVATVNNLGRVSYANVKSDQKASGFDLGGAYYFNQGMTSVKLQAGMMSGKTKSLRLNNDVAVADYKHTVKTWAVGFEHKLSQRTLGWVEYEGQKTTGKLDQDRSFRSNDKANRVNVGLRHDF